MVVVFDNSVLCLLLHPQADVPNDPATGTPIAQIAERIEHLVDHLGTLRARILIPTPVLAEFLTVASTEYLDEITGSAHFDVVAFDQRAAIEASVMHRQDLASAQGKKQGLANWQKVKVDRQSPGCRDDLQHGPRHQDTG